MRRSKTTLTLFLFSWLFAAPVITAEVLVRQPGPGVELTVSWQARVKAKAAGRFVLYRGPAGGSLAVMARVELNPAGVYSVADSFSQRSLAGVPVVYRLVFVEKATGSEYKLATKRVEVDLIEMFPDATLFGGSPLPDGLLRSHRMEAAQNVLLGGSVVFGLGVTPSEPVAPLKPPPR